MRSKKRKRHEIKASEDSKSSGQMLSVRPTKKKMWHKLLRKINIGPFSTVPEDESSVPRSRQNIEGKEDGQKGLAMQASFLKTFENLSTYGLLPTFDDAESERAFALYKYSAMDRRHLMFLSNCLSYAVLFCSVWNLCWRGNEPAPDYKPFEMRKSRLIYTGVLAILFLTEAMMGSITQPKAREFLQRNHVFLLVFLSCPLVLEIFFHEPYLFWQSFLLTILHVFQISSELLRHSVPMVFGASVMYVIQATIQKEPKLYDSKLFLFFTIIIILGALLNFSRATECIQREAFKCWHHIRILDIQLTQEVTIADAFLASQLPSALLQNQADLRYKDMVKNKKRRGGGNKSYLWGKQFTHNLLKGICDNEGCVDRRFSAVVVAQILGVETKTPERTDLDSLAEARPSSSVFSNTEQLESKASILAYPELIEQIFDNFDCCCKQHGLEKVRSVGLCYVASSGLPQSLGTARRDALAALRLACDMICISETLDVDICVGVEAGLVVGGLLRVKPFSYSLLGEALDSAMQLSQTCVAGQVFMGTRITALLKRFWPSGKDNEQDVLEGLRDLQRHHTMPLFPNGQRAKVTAISNPYKLSWWGNTSQKFKVSDKNLCTSPRLRTGASFAGTSFAGTGSELSDWEKKNDSESPAMDSKDFDEMRIEMKEDVEAAAKSGCVKKVEEGQKVPMLMRSMSNKHLRTVVPVPASSWDDFSDLQGTTPFKPSKHIQENQFLSHDTTTGMPLPISFFQAMHYRRKIHGLGIRESAYPLVSGGLHFNTMGPQQPGNTPAPVSYRPVQSQYSAYPNPNNTNSDPENYSIGLSLRSEILRSGQKFTVKVKEVDLDEIMKSMNDPLMNVQTYLRGWLCSFKNPVEDKKFSEFRDAYFRNGQPRVFVVALHCFSAYNSLFFVLSQRKTLLSGVLPYVIIVLMILCMYTGCFLFSLAISLLKQPPSKAYLCHFFFFFWICCYFLIITKERMSKVEIFFHSCFVFSPLLHVRNSYAFFGLFFCFLGYSVLSETNSNEQLWEIFPVMCLLSLLMMIKWQAERRTIALYLSVVKLLWHKLSTYSYQKKDTNWMIDKLMPYSSLLSSLSKNDRKLVSCPNASIVYIEVLSLPKLNGLVSAADLCHFQKKILDMLESIAVELGALRVRVFAQGYVVLFGTLSGHANSHIEQSLEFIRQVDYRVDMFNQTNKIALGVSLGFTSGPVCIGFVGGQRSTFDVVGRVVDLAGMLCQWGEGMTTVCTSTKDLIEKALQKLQRKPHTKFIPRKSLVLPDNTTLDTFELEVTPKKNAVPRVPKVEEFTLVRLLGKGSYGRVYLAREMRPKKDAHGQTPQQQQGEQPGGGTQQGELYAIKVLPKRLVEDINEWMRVELAILVQAQNPHVVSLKYCLQSKTKVYLCMEYIRGGTLKHIIKKEKIDLHGFQFWFAELVLALEYIHTLGIIHGDLKPENCMIGEDGHLKLIDFGLSTILPGKKKQAIRSPNWTRDAFQELPEHALALMQKIMPQRAGDSTDTSLSSLQRLGSLSRLTKGGMLRSKVGQGKFSSPRPSSPKSHQTGGRVMHRHRNSHYHFTEPNSRRHRKTRVLVVDGDEFSRASTKTMLKLKNFEVFVAANGKIALRKLREPGYAKKIDVMLLDMDMPVMDGPTTLKKLQADVQLKQIPIIMMSADDCTSALEQCLKNGAKEFIIKPLQADATGLLLRYALIRNRDQHWQLPLMEEEENSSVVTMHPSKNTNMNNSDRKASANSNTTSIVGTPCYMAPEIITFQGYDSAVDWWAYGILMYECCLGTVPFSGDNLPAVFAAIKSGMIDWQNLQENAPNLKDLIARLLCPDPEKRLGASSVIQVKRHPYFANIGFDSLYQTGKPPFYPTSMVNETPVAGRCRQKAEKYFYSGEIKSRENMKPPPSEDSVVLTKPPLAVKNEKSEQRRDSMQLMIKDTKDLNAVLKKSNASPSSHGSDEGMKKSGSSSLFLEFKAFDAGESWDQAEKAILTSMNQKKMQY